MITIPVDPAGPKPSLLRPSFRRDAELVAPSDDCCRLRQTTDGCEKKGANDAKELAGRGMNLVLFGRSIDALQDLTDSLGAQYGVRCVVLQADLAASDAVKRIVTELERLDLKIDLLINNAGLGLTGDFMSHDLAEELASIQVN